MSDLLRCGLKKDEDETWGGIRARGGLYSLPEDFSKGWAVNKNSFPTIWLRMIELMRKTILQKCRIRRGKVTFCRLMGIRERERCIQQKQLLSCNTWIIKRRTYSIREILCFHMGHHV